MPAHYQENRFIHMYVNAWLYINLLYCANKNTAFLNILQKMKKQQRTWEYYIWLDNTTCCFIQNSVCILFLIIIHKWGSIVHSKALCNISCICSQVQTVQITWWSKLTDIRGDAFRKQNCGWEVKICCILKHVSMFVWSDEQVQFYYHSFSYWHPTIFMPAFFTNKISPVFHLLLTYHNLRYDGVFAFYCVTTFIAISNVF